MRGPEVSDAMPRVCGAGSRTTKSTSRRSPRFSITSIAKCRVRDWRHRRIHRRRSHRSMAAIEIGRALTRRSARRGIECADERRTAPERDCVAEVIVGGAVARYELVRFRSRCQQAPKRRTPHPAGCSRRRLRSRSPRAQSYHQARPKVRSALPLRRRSRSAFAAAPTCRRHPRKCRPSPGHCAPSTRW